jgi:hypothetical protein
VANELNFNWPMRPEYWNLLVPGTDVTVVKRTHNGEDVVNYPGRVVPTNADSPWVEVEATWTVGTVVQGPLTFETGDTLREFFSWQHPFNAFAVYTTSNAIKGWYANVTYPSWVERDGDELRLVWQDLWLDVVSDVDGIIVNLDDDELAASGTAGSDSLFHRAIIDARHQVRDHLSGRTGPIAMSIF